MRQRRHRRYGQEATKRNVVTIRRALAISVLAIILIVAANKVLSALGVGNAVRSTAAQLEIEENGVVSVSIDGGTFKRAENDIKLYAGDTIVTSPNNFASLTLFDDSYVRLNESTQLQIVKSMQGQKQSELSFELEEGSIWLASPPLSTFSGAIARTVVTPFLHTTIPSKTEAVLSDRSLSVFAADGVGLEVTIAGSDERIIVGEGQQFTLPVGGEQEADLYVHRNPLDSNQLASPFVAESRSKYTNTVIADNSEEDTTGDTQVADTPLTVELPENNTVVDTSTVTVSGRVGSAVERVRINGYFSPVEDGRFEQELVLADEDEVSITIEAVDESGVVVAQSLRSVQRNRKPPEPPSITAPAATGQTYQTNQTEIEIAGTAPQGAIGILVNDYRLQLFNPGDTTWSYLANTAFNNFTYGTNTYEVIAINRGGYRSETATVTIVLDENATPGVVNDPSESPDTPSENLAPPRTVEEAELPQNIPQMPGSISVFAPEAGTSHTTNQQEVLIEGNVATDTHTVWVNGYQLRLYEPGKDFFNYIASVELSTLKRGENTYEIVARSRTGHILDKVTYTIMFNP